MPFVEIRALNKRYRGGFELHDINLSIEKGEIFTLMGPSGSGKTSLLRNICGLETPDAGSILIDGREITHLDTSKRGIGLVFQDLALFPHMTVYENIAFGLRSVKMEEKAKRGRVMELAERLGISELIERYPGQISGGQGQRVALARTVAPFPSLLLLDEPLSSLDEQLRAGVRSFMKSFVKQMGLTAIYVTHDHREGLFMADRAGLIFDGTLSISGRPDELFLKPADEKSAAFFGYNIIEMDGHRVAFLPGECEIGRGDMSARVISTGFEGEMTRVYAQVDGREIHLFIPNHRNAPRNGETIKFDLLRPVMLR